MAEALPARATRARHVVLGLTLPLAAVVCLDRVAISMTAMDIRRDLRLSDCQLGATLKTVAE
jgi:hypothetical protein